MAAEPGPSASAGGGCPCAGRPHPVPLARLHRARAPLRAAPAASGCGGPGAAPPRPRPGEPRLPLAPLPLGRAQVPADCQPVRLSAALRCCPGGPRALVSQFQTRAGSVYPPELRGRAGLAPHAEALERVPRLGEGRGLRFRTALLLVVVEEQLCSSGEPAAGWLCVQKHRWIGETHGCDKKGPWFCHEGVEKTCAVQDLCV